MTRDDIQAINDLNALSVKLSEGVKLLGRYGREYAKAEYEYKILLAQTALKLRAQDMPVTLVDKVVYGEKEVALKRLARDSAEVMYKAAHENINSIKLQIRILDNQISREWSVGGRN